MKGVLKAWTVEDRDRAIKLRREGYSAREIGGLLKPKRSRSAVIGLLYRAGEPGVLVNSEHGSWRGKRFDDLP